MTEPQQNTFTSSYAWLVAPGDRLQVDYTTPTRVRSWLEAKVVEPLRTDPEDKQQRYGQWVAQLLQNQLGVPLVDLYYQPGASTWPLTLREDVVAALDQYFANQQNGA